MGEIFDENFQVKMLKRDMQIEKFKFYKRFYIKVCMSWSYPFSYILFCEVNTSLQNWSEDIDC